MAKVVILRPKNTKNYEIFNNFSILPVPQIDDPAALCRGLSFLNFAYFWDSLAIQGDRTTAIDNHHCEGEVNDS